MSQDCGTDGTYSRKAVQMQCLDEVGTKLIGSCMQARQGGMAAAQRIMLTAQPRPFPISLLACLACPTGRYFPPVALEHHTP